jgi:pimeloyl-ACP methyl ester carboxylesterase
VAGSTAGSFVDLAHRNGFPVLAVDRPGYRESDLLPEAENTFARQAELLDAAIAELLPATPCREVVLVGHSIGGMTALEIAARRPAWPLIGICATGMGRPHPCRRAGGAARCAAAHRRRRSPGAGTRAALVRTHRLRHRRSRRGRPEVVRAVPMVELAYAPTWASLRLADVAAEVRVPVHHALGEFDALRDPSPDARDLFLSAFPP